MACTCTKPMDPTFPCTRFLAILLSEIPLVANMLGAEFPSHCSDREQRPHRFNETSDTGGGGTGKKKS